MPQFFVRCADVDAEAATALLREQEAHHLLRVLRARPRDRVQLFDGNGRRWVGRLERATGNEARVAELSPLPANEPPVCVTLIQSLPKGDRWEWILEKGCELGVRRFQPVLSEHSVARIPPARVPGRRARWEGRVLAAAKQCGRGFLPQVLDPVALAAYLQDLPPASAEEVRLLLAEPGCADAPQAVLSPGIRPHRVSLAVGPEGGWSSQDVGLLAAHGFQALGLGPRVLRVETAVVTGLSLLLTRWGDLENCCGK